MKYRSSRTFPRPLRVSRLVIKSLPIKDRRSSFVGSQSTARSLRTARPKGSCAPRNCSAGRPNLFTDSVYILADGKTTHKHKGLPRFFLNSVQSPIPISHEQYVCLVRLIPGVLWILMFLKKYGESPPGSVALWLFRKPMHMMTPIGQWPAFYMRRFICKHKRESHWRIEQSKPVSTVLSNAPESEPMSFLVCPWLPWTSLLNQSVKVATVRDSCSLSHSPGFLYPPMLALFLRLRTY